MPLSQQDWISFQPPSILPLSHPWTSRYHDSQLLHFESNPSESISTTDVEIYGPSSSQIAFRIGNGGAGYTGVLKLLCETFISLHGNNFRIGWVSNHSRHSQIALLANVVQVALTYEPENEDLSIKEGWARRVGRCFNDHFILVGPELHDMGVSDMKGAMKKLADSEFLFHSRGDGSATFTREQRLWKMVGVQVDGVRWIQTYPCTPYEALVRAEKEQAFLITDRATFLTAKRDGVIDGLKVHVEGAVELLNPCAAMVWNEKFRNGAEQNVMAVKFADWLKGDVAQRIVKEYGQTWRLGKALFTEAAKDEFDEGDRLSYQRSGLKAKM